MATKKGVWNLQQVRDKQLQSLWDYDSSVYALYVWGANDRGQLGLNEAIGVAKNSPVQVPGSWSKIAGSSPQSKHLLAIKPDGTLWSWGENEKGQLGLGNKTYYSSPVQIPGTTWDTVQQGHRWSLATKTDGTLWVWGWNQYGQLGLNNKSDYDSPTQIPGTTWSTGTNKLSVGTAQSYAIKTDGTLWAWGDNNSGALGLNALTDYSSPKQIPGSWSYVSTSGHNNNQASAIRSDGTFWSWGNGAGGVYGTNSPANVDYSSPIQLGSDTTWKGFGTGQRTVFATKTDGSFWSWGLGTSGQLASNDRNTRSSPLQIPGTTFTSGVSGGYMGFTIASKTDGTLWSWGSSGDKGALGAGLSPTVKRSSPVQIGTETDWGYGAGFVSATYWSAAGLRKL